MIRPIRMPRTGSLKVSPETMRNPCQQQKKTKKQKKKKKQKKNKKKKAKEEGGDEGAEAKAE